MNAIGPNSRLFLSHVRTMQYVSLYLSKEKAKERDDILFWGGGEGAGEELTLQAAFHFLTHLPLLKRDETVSGYRCVQHFGKRKRGQWCNCLIDSVAGQRGLVRSVSQDVRREEHCRGQCSVKLLAGEAGWGWLEESEIKKNGGQALVRGQRL